MQFSGDHSSWLLLFLDLISSVQFSSVAQSYLIVTPGTTACQASLSITNSWSLLKLISIESMIPSRHLILCHPLLLPPPIFLSTRVFSKESVLCIRWQKYWSFSFSINPSSEYSGLISFRMDWLDLLAVQGTLKSLLQHHSSKASILWCSAFFRAQLSHPYMTTGKTIPLNRWTFVGKAMSAFNMLSGLVITFLPRSKRLNFMAVVTFCSDFGAQEIKICHCFHFFPSTGLEFCLFKTETHAHLGDTTDPVPDHSSKVGITKQWVNEFFPQCI